MRVALPERVFKLAVERFALVCPDENLVRMLATVAKSLAEYKAGNHRISLVLAWFVIESVLAKKWEHFLDGANLTYADKSKRINSDRRARLLNSRDYPVSVVSNVLELVGSIDFSLFKRVDEVRAQRNAVVHDDQFRECQPEHCGVAIRTALDVALEQQPFTISPSLRYAVIGR